MSPKIANQSTRSSVRHLLIWTKNDAVVAELHDLIDPALAWLLVHSETQAPSLSDSSPLLLLTDQSVSPSLIDRLLDISCLLWTFGNPAPAAWAANFGPGWDLSVLDRLPQLLRRDLAGIRFAPGRGLLDQTGKWFCSPELEALLLQYPRSLPLSLSKQRKVRVRLRRFGNQRLTLVRSVGEGFALALNSQELAHV